MKLFRYFLLNCLVLTTCHIYPQNSFEINFITTGWAEINDGIKTFDGNYIFIINNAEIMPDPVTSIIIKADQDGSIINDVVVDFYDYVRFFKILFDDSSGQFVIIGNIAEAPEFVTDSIIISTWTPELNLIDHKIIESPFTTNTFVSAALLNNNGQIVLTGYTAAVGAHHGFAYKLDTAFNIIDQYVFDFWCRTNSIVQYSDDNGTGYLITMFGKPHGFSTGEYLIKTDDSLNVIAYYPTNTIFGSGLTCLTHYSDSLFILTGKYRLFIPPDYLEKHVGVEIIDHNNNLFASNTFGKLPDTIDYPGIYSGAVVIDNDNIFVPGTSNVNEMQYPYAPTPSWFMLNKVDGDLNLKWQKFYGGDAHYFLFGVIPSHDGGCVMFGTRYHPDNPTGIDGYILKVGPDGLVSVPEVPGSLQVKEVILYPNPGSSKLHIQSGHDNLELMMFNAEGKMIHNERLKQYHHLINTASWPAGMYIYRITKNNDLFDSGKWIKSD